MAPKLDVVPDVDVNDDWADLTPIFESKKVNTPKRTVVDVPPAALALLRQAHKNNERVVLPVRDEKHYQERADVFYSAGILLQTETGEELSVITVGGRLETDAEGNAVFVLRAKGDERPVTHIRATVAEKRGRKSTK